MKEHRRMRAELDALNARDPLAPLRQALRAQEQRQAALADDRPRRRRPLSSPPSLDTTFDPDDTVN